MSVHCTQLKICGKELVSREHNCDESHYAEPRIAEPRRPFKPDQIRIDRGDYTRASGLIQCPVCGVAYFDHPTVRGYEWLVRACDGRLLKL